MHPARKQRLLIILAIIVTSGLATGLITYALRENMNLFTIGDGQQSIPVIYTGILPDLFAEEQAAIAKGKWDGKIFTATEVLAKHDENYTPPEISDSMKKLNAPKPSMHPK